MNGEGGPVMRQDFLAKLVSFTKSQSLHSCRFQANGPVPNVSAALIRLKVAIRSIKLKITIVLQEPKPHLMFCIGLFPISKIRDLLGRDMKWVRIRPFLDLSNRWNWLYWPVDI